MILKKISQEIDKYLVIMPNANSYSICRQKDTKSILEYVHSNLTQTKPHHTMLPELEKNIIAISKWDGVKHEPEETEFKLLLDKVKKDLIQIKALASI